jgi:hypothetical protein
VGAPGRLSPTSSLAAGHSRILSSNDQAVVFLAHSDNFAGNIRSNAGIVITSRSTIAWPQLSAAMDV